MIHTVRLYIYNYLLKNRLPEFSTDVPVCMHHKTLLFFSWKNKSKSKTSMFCWAYLLRTSRWSFSGDLWHVYLYLNPVYLYLCFYWLCLPVFQFINPVLFPMPISYHRSPHSVKWSFEKKDIIYLRLFIIFGVYVYILFYTYIYFSVFTEPQILWNSVMKYYWHALKMLYTLPKSYLF